jgi:uncharacterized protein (DUF1697 family)
VLAASPGTRCECGLCDVTDERQGARAVEDCVARLGGIDAADASAGYLDAWLRKSERAHRCRLPGVWLYWELMKSFVALLRGINVGGKNIIPMSDLKTCLEKLGLENVSTYIASGNVLFSSSLPAGGVHARIEAALSRSFKLDDEVVRVLVLSRKQLQSVVDRKPKGFGEHPEKYHSDAIFLMGVAAADALPAFSPREGVDRVWPGTGVIYSQRLSAMRTKSRLNRIMALPLYKSMTIRNWNTTVKLAELLKDMDAGA